MKSSEVELSIVVNISEDHIAQQQNPVLCSLLIRLSRRDQLKFRDIVVDWLYAHSHIGGVTPKQPIKDREGDSKRRGKIASYNH